MDTGNHLIGARRVDRILGIVSIVMWVAVAIVAVCLPLYCGISGAVYSVLIIAVTGICWSSVTRAWIKERAQLAKGVVTYEALKEISMLRESIEKLRKALESGEQMILKQAYG